MAEDLPGPSCRHATRVGVWVEPVLQPVKGVSRSLRGGGLPDRVRGRVVRDRFEGKQRRYLYRPQLETLVASEISTGRALQLVDLTGAAAYELGVDTDAKAARDHAKGQRFAEALHRDTDVDGMLFSSRLTGALCAAIFDRAAAKLSATTPVALPMVGALPAELTRLGITVRRRRAMS